MEANREQKQVANQERPGLFGMAAILTALFLGCLMVWHNGMKIAQWWHTDNLVPGEAVLWDVIRQDEGHVGDLDLPKNRTPIRLFGIFEIEIEGKRYRSGEVDLWNRPKELREGELISVFYNPDNPSEIYLSKELPLFGPALAFLVGLLFGVAGAYGLICNIRIGKSPNNDAGGVVE